MKLNECSTKFGNEQVNSEGQIKILVSVDGKGSGVKARLMN